MSQSPKRPVDLRWSVARSQGLLRAEVGVSRSRWCLLIQQLLECRCCWLQRRRELSIVSQLLVLGLELVVMDLHALHEVSVLVLEGRRTWGLFRNQFGRGALTCVSGTSQITDHKFLDVVIFEVGVIENLTNLGTVMGIHPKDALNQLNLLSFYIYQSQYRIFPKSRYSSSSRKVPVRAIHLWKAQIPQSFRRGEYRAPIHQFCGRTSYSAPSLAPYTHRYHKGFFFLQQLLRSRSHTASLRCVSWAECFPAENYLTRTFMSLCITPLRCRKSIASQTYLNIWRISGFVSWWLRTFSNNDPPSTYSSTM